MLSWGSVHGSYCSNTVLDWMAWPELFSICLFSLSCVYNIHILRLEFQRIPAQQTQVHPMLSWGSVHGSYCSNTVLDWMAWPELFSICLFSLSCVYNIHRGVRPKVSLRWQDLRLNKRRLKTCLWQFWKIGKDDKLHFGLFIPCYELTQCRCHSRICRSEVRPARGSGRRVAGDPRTSPKDGEE